MDVISWFASRFRVKKADSIRVHHGYRDEVGGPFVKLERMNRFFPNYEKNYNVVYGVSGTNLPLKVLDRARRKRIPIICHMNSCWHPAYASDYHDKNELLKALHNEYSQFVVYGSRQAMNGAARYLGEVKGQHQMIYNAVDTDFFHPGLQTGDQKPCVLAAGLHQFTHRLEPLIRAMPLVEKKLPGVELLIAGTLVPGKGIFDCGKETIHRMVEESGFSRVSYIDSYRQSEAPDIYRRADMLVHLKHMDWTPNVVAEAMACGVPVVHTGNGGVPEIVEDTGYSLDIPEDWDRIRIAEPEAVAHAILEVWHKRVSLSRRARERACQCFDLNQWVESHRRIFEDLLSMR